MNRSTKQISFLTLAMVILLAACAPAAAPTQDPALVQQLIEQSVQLTVAAQNAQATEQQALIVPSNTPLPTQTEAVPPTPLVPTATPFVIVPPTNTVVVSSGGGGGAVVPTARLDYACDSRNRKPYDNTVFKPKEPFDIKWTIVNTGTKTLRAGTDLKYFSGTQLTNVDRVEMPELGPGDTYDLILDAVAPDKIGFYVMTWTVEGQLCYPYVAIYVDK